MKLWHVIAIAVIAYIVGALYPSPVKMIPVIGGKVAA
jgi:hypothetical protein